MLTIPQAQFPAGPAALMQPLVFTVSGVLTENGEPAVPSELASVGVLVFRGSPGAPELWDEAQKTWVPSPPDQALGAAKVLAGTPSAADPPTWQATLVAIAQKDTTGAPVFSSAVSGMPSYFVRAVVQRLGGAAEVGQASAPFTFFDASEKARFTAEFDTPSTKDEDAHRVRIMLKGDARQQVGYVEIRSLPDFQVEIAACSAAGSPTAKVLLSGNGQITLAPASGSRVVISGDLEVEQVFYRRNSDGVKEWLG